MMNSSMDIASHPVTLRIKEAIFNSINPSERHRVCVGAPERRQLEGWILIENFETLCVSKLIQALPSRCRVFCRAPPNLGVQRLSRIEIYYPIESLLWRCRLVSFVFMWVVLPGIVSVVFITGLPGHLL